MAITAVGSVALDTVTTSAGTVRDILGGSLTYFSFSASVFVPVHVVAVVGQDFPECYLEWFRAHQLQLDGLEQQAGRTFRWSGQYSDDFSARVTISLELNVFEQFNPELPPAARRQPYLFLGNIDPALQRHVLEQMEQPAFVVSDTIDYWILHKRDELRALFPHINLFLLNDEEARLLADTPDEVAAAKWLVREGLDTVIVKRGASGSLLATTQGVSALPAFKLDDGRVADPTGAGDSFAGGLLGYIAAQQEAYTEATLIDAIRHGAAVASSCVESIGVDQVRKISRDEIENRVHHLRQVPIEACA